MEKVTVFTLMAKVLESETLNPEQKIQLLDEIRKARPALEDRWIYRWVVYFLGGALSLSIIVILYCVYQGLNEIPEGLIALGSGALGALSGLLANRPNSEEE